ncbi:MAG: family 10 glycosylhydrolase, partial [Desulfobulbaceae bacterium]|nr:family 10 glycosylhydrolase [Desulfobulbaceae bacterium]
MKAVIRITLPVVLILFLISTTYNQASAQPGTGAWVIRWHIDSPSEIKEICSEAKDSFSNLLVQVRGRADAYYDSDIAPRAEELREQPIDFDPLSSILDQCKTQNLQAWLNVYYLWTGESLPEDPLHPAQQHNSWIVNDNKGRSVSDYSPLEQSQGWIEGVYADPASLSYRSYFGKVIQELIEKYDVKGIHLDFIRYPGLAYGYDNRLTHTFFQQWGFDPRWLPDTVSENDILSWLDGSMHQEQRILTTGTLLWAAMRADEVTSMVRVIRTILTSSNRDIILSATIFPDQISAFL